MIFPRTVLSLADPFVVSGKSIFTRPSPVSASKSAAKSEGSRSATLPSPVCRFQPDVLFDPASASASMLPSPVCRVNMSNRPLARMFPSRVCRRSAARVSTATVRRQPFPKRVQPGGNRPGYMSAQIACRTTVCSVLPRYALPLQLPSMHKTEVSIVSAIYRSQLFILPVLLL